MTTSTTVKCAWLPIRMSLLSAGLLSAFLWGRAPASLAAQSATAGLQGTIVDSTGAVLAGVTITAVNQATAVSRQVQSAIDGSFVIPMLPPGRYNVTGSLNGFRPSELRDIVLNVDDRLVVRMELSLVGIGEAVTVSADWHRINTSPGVGTVIDRRFVESLPLNGRSFQALLELTPGVVLTRSSGSSEGQFSVNGQRTTSNYFTIDGVSAPTNPSASTSGMLGAAASGQLPGLTALGGTSGLVSVEALQEFRLQTSGYAPEFGRMPGGQVSLVTRSGTNTFHGSAFEYFRDGSLDASDWFINRSGMSPPELRQHDFGGVFGGPILRNRTFAFGSYERLELTVPQVKGTAVPTVNTRAGSLAAVRPYLDALPQPNGRDLGNGFAEFLALYSDPSQVDSRSLRIDHNATGSLKFFGRVSDAPSFSEVRGPSYGFSNVTNSNIRAGTIGSTWVLSRRVLHDVRVSLATSGAPSYQRQTPIGGAALLSPILLPSGRSAATTGLTFFLTGGGTASWGPYPDSSSRQFNIIDSVTLPLRSHELKVGMDFRRIDTVTRGAAGRDLLQFDVSGLSSGRISLFSMTFSDSRDRTISFRNLSFYAQDNWRLLPRLILNYGVRWESGVPPDVSGVPAVTLERTDDLYGRPVGLDVPGAPLWRATHGNVAPRISVSHIVSDDSRRSLVIKAGFGTFFDMGYGQAGNVAGWSYPYSITKSQANVVLPLGSDVLRPPVLGVDAPSTLTAMDRGLQQPYTFQWNFSADQSIGRRQSVSVNYVGASGHRLLRGATYRLALQEWPATPVLVTVMKNLGYSDYQGLQMQFNRRLDRGVQAMVSYTLGRSRDTESSEAVTSIPAERLSPEVDYGYSSFDLRHVFNAALTYQVPQPRGPRVWSVLARDWGVDVIVRAHSGYPLNLTATVPFPPINVFVRPNLVPEQPIWLNDPDAPGGKRLNRQAFSVPPPQTQGNLPRGAIRGFGLKQVDFSLRRELSLAGPLRLHLRFEAFNLFNTPNFGDPSNRIENADFGLSTQMLGRSLGGQNALYQVGGPRSIQLVTKMVF